MSKVRLEIEGGLRIVVLNDPDKRNSIDEAMRLELLQTFLAVRDDPDATALVVTGEGSAFCAGADLPAIFGDTSRSVAQLRDDLRDVYACFLVLRSLQIPTIAAIQGPAVGAGLNLALACDLRVVGPGAKLAATFSQIGLHPGGGCTWFLVDVLGEQRALQLLLDGGTVEGAEAVTAGLAVQLADDPKSVAREMGRRYADMDGQLVRDIKRTVKTAARDGFDASLELESWAQASSATKPAIQQFLARFRK
jgi:enoyl-CoA hydratase